MISNLIYQKKYLLILGLTNSIHFHENKRRASSVSNLTPYLNEAIPEPDDKTIEENVISSDLEPISNNAKQIITIKVNNTEHNDEDNGKNQGEKNFKVNFESDYMAPDSEYSDLDLKRVTSLTLNDARGTMKDNKVPSDLRFDGLVKTPALEKAEIIDISGSIQSDSMEEMEMVDK